MDLSILELCSRVDGHDFWPSYLDRPISPTHSIGFHLAVFIEPFLTHLLDGRKTVDSRFSKTRCAPFGQVASGDVLLIKKSAGPICGVALIREVSFYDLAQDSLDVIRMRYQAQICADDAFWEARRDRVFVTILELTQMIPITPLSVVKRDRRGWVSLQPQARFLVSG